MKRTRLLPVVILAAMLLLQIFSSAPMTTPFRNPGEDQFPLIDNSQNVDLGDGTYVDIAPDETLLRYSLADQGWSEWTGGSSELVSNEFGNTSLSATDLEMKYLTSNTTTDVNLNVSTGTNWEAYYVRADITEITENRTWTTNPGFTGSATDWTLGTTSGGGYSSETSVYNSTGHGTGDGTPDFFIDSNSGGAPYYYSNNDRAWAQQTMSVPRGEVVWAGFRTDYWADTRDDTHYAMTGAFSIYVRIEGNTVWELVFSDIGAEETWYDSGLVFVPTTNLNLPTDQSVTIEVGLWCKGSYGYAPNILPAAKFDNVELYLKTRATPTSLNMEMDGIAVSNNAGYGSGYVIETPATPWITDPVQLNFTWAPTPINPDPNRTILIEFDVDINMFARRLDFGTVKEINPTSYGERFSIQNGTDAFYSTYFYANIPTGYVNKYFFNASTPDNRDVYFVARPLAPATNLTSGWNGGDINDGFLNVSAYDITTEAGRYGYWRILSSAPNMITDVELYDPNASGWADVVDLRAGNSTQVRAFVGSAFQNSIVNITIFDPDGTKWYSVNVTANALGYATTDTLTFAGANASAGSWIVQATCNDVGTNTDWRSTGFFKRPFSVTHESTITLNYPTDAISTWETNVTYGDLLLIVLTVNDTDSEIVVPGGTLTLNWAAGVDTFDDSGNGQYTKVLDTSLLTNKGQYTIDLTWSAPNYDSAIASLDVNVNYAAEITSSDYPGIQGAVGSSQSFTVDFKNVNGTGITGASLVCNWTSTYNVVELGGGQYRFDLDTVGVLMDEYPVLVNGSAIYVEPQSMLMFVEVREIYNTVSYSANQLSIPLGESDSFSITWWDTDNSQPITGQAAAITCNWTSFHTVGEQNYTVVEGSPGVYDVTIFTESDDPLTAVDEFYTVLFDVSLKDYQNHTFSIGVQVRRHNTQFILDSPVEQTPVGQDIIVLVFYQDTDLLQGITNISGDVQLLITSPGVPSLVFSSGSSSLGDGHYNITIPSGQWGTIGWKNLTLSISWTGGDTYYSQVLDTTVRILGTDTDLYLETAPTATNYLNNFTFTVVYYDVINATRISNATNNVFLLITPLTGGHSVTQSDFVVFELGASPGTYSFELNASLLGSARSFRFQLDFMWSQGITPLYENQTMTVTLVVLGISTYVDYIPVQSTPYGETADFSFSYINSLTTQKIANSSQLIVGLVEGGIPFTITYDSGTRTFTIHINTTSLGVGSSVLNLNLTWIGDPYYEQAFQVFTVNVVERSTQLSHLSYVTPQWGDIASIEFVYTDLISGTSSSMTGTLTLDSGLTGFYIVTPLGNGHFLVELDTTYFGSNGVFVINASIVYTGSNFAADAAESFSLSVIERITQIGYESPDATEYLDSVIFSVTYTDDGTGVPIVGATILVDCSNSSQTLQPGTNYYIMYLGFGEYQITVESVALGNIGNFELNITVSKSGSPFYSSAMTTVNARVIQRTTQILITQTPGEVPFGEFVVIKFKYTDFWSGTTISIDKSHITLTHGAGMTVIVDGDYTLIDYGTFYEISFNSTILNAGALVSGHAIQIAIDKSSGSPYYAPRSVSTSATTVERPTQILFPLVEDTPYTKNVTINFVFTDFITGEGITGATVDITFTNGTPTYYIEEVGEGAYRVLVLSTQFGNIGTIYFNVTLSKTGVPFYSQRSASNVPAKIIVVQTTLIVEVPPIASQPVGQPILVNVTFTDTETGSPLSGATITTDWETLHLTDVLIAEIGGGLYRITINTTGLLAQSYVFTIQAELTFHFTSNITVTVTPGAATTQIILSKTTVYVDWGNSVEIRLDVQDPYSGTLIPGMNVTLLWNGTLQVFTDLSNGTYSLDIDTSISDFGIYQPQITVSREFYQPRQVSLTIIVSKASGSIIPEQSLFNVITGTAHDFWIYLNDTSNGGPVLGATISMEWNNTVYIMTANGTPGYYVGSIDGVGFGLGQYELNLLAVQTNYIILDRTLDIFIVPVPTGITLPNDVTGFVVYFGEMLNVSIAYDDTFHGGYIIGANVSYILGGTSGQLIDLLNGSYSISIDTSTLAAQVTYLKITATYKGFETKIRSFVTNILPIPTVLDVDLSSKDGFFQDVVSYTVNFTDTLNEEFLVGATVDIEWEGGSGSIIDLGNGTYTISMTLNVTTPKPYDVNIRFTFLNYETATLKVRLDLVRIPTSVIGPSTIEVPVNDTLTFYYTINNDVTNETITDVFALAYWEGLEEVVLETHANGSFMLVVLGDLPRDGYTIALSFTNDIYQLSPFDIDLIIRSVRTSLIVSNTSIFTTPNAPLTITVTYLDTDHHEGITGAEILVTSDSAIQYNPTLLLTPGDNGTYILSFFVNGGGFFEINLRFSNGQYEDGILTINVESDLTQDQLLAQTVTYTGGTLLILAAALLFFYVRVWSIPKQLRALNRMIKSLSKGKVPRPASAPSRHLLVLAIVNEELRPLGLQKEPEEVIGESIEAHVPEVNELLDRLAEITGLGPLEVDAFRADLATMKASERSGFLREVIEQEEARRADALARVDEIVEPDVEVETLDQSPEDMDEIRTKLLTKGMAPEEIEVILEEAKNLSKADLEALLDSLGIRLE